MSNLTSMDIKQISEDTKRKPEEEFTDSEKANVQYFPVPFEGRSVTTPHFYKLGRRWVIENQAGNRELVIEEPMMGEVVFMINCADTMLRINGKVNLITTESCKNSQILFESVISAVEVINCKRMEIQVTKHCGAIRVDNTEDCRIFLSKDSFDCEVITSKSTEINVLIPQDGGDMVECPIPTQFKSVVLPNHKDLQTTPIENT